MEIKKITRRKVVLFFGLLISLTSFATTSNNHAESVWTKMALNDLSTTKALLLKDSPKAQALNTHYSRWLNAGYILAEEKAKTINSYPGYISVMQFYLNGFRDLHTSVVPLLKIINPSEKWPGFVVGERNKAVVVTYSNPNNYGKNIFPPINARLISCDGLSVQKLIQSNILPFDEVNPHYPATWSKAVPYLFVWGQNPFIHQPQQCIFLINGHKKTYHLTWEVVENPSPLSLGIKNFQEKIEQAATGPTPNFEISPFGKHAVWISIPIFAYGLSTQGTTTTSLLNHIANQVKKYRDKQILVFDLRGNTGGDPEYMRPIIINLYGKAYLRNLGKRFIWNKPESTLFLATNRNLQHMIQTNSPQAMIEGMKKAIASKKKYYFYHTQVLEKGDKNVQNPVKAKVILLTDGRCGSECNSFVMVMKSIPGVIQLGQPTASLTNSTWNTVKVFSDSASAIVYPTGLILTPIIQDGSPIFPKYTYHGYMGNTEALKKWVLKLYKNDKLNF